MLKDLFLPNSYKLFAEGWVLLLLLGLWGVTGVQAQTATPTPTDTPTVTPTATATPDVNVRWVLTPYANPEGTPVVQEVVFAYEVDTGDVAITILLGALLISVIVMGLLIQRQEGKGS